MLLCWYNKWDCILQCIKEYTNTINANIRTNFEKWPKMPTEQEIEQHLMLLVTVGMHFNI